MNIMQYRAIKAEEAKQASQTPDQTQVTQTQTTPPTQPIQTKEPEQTKEEPKVPDKITIDGVGEITLDELKNGYLRQSDYTKKTQDLSSKRKEVEDAVQLYENLKQNPQIVQQLQQVAPVPRTLDPNQTKVVELEQKVYDMMLQQEISDLQRKYPDFEVREVLQTAQEKKLSNLEDAYLIAKSRKTPITSIDAETLKKQLRDEVLKELETERQATGTIITSRQGAPVVTDNAPHISEAEKKVAKAMRLSEAEYVKWRDAGRKK